MSGVLVRLRSRLPRDLLAVLGPFLGSRLALLLLPAITTGLLSPVTNRSASGWPAPPFPPTPTWHVIVTGWERFDALWFLRIAERGYATTDGSAAFFPGFPLAMRLVSAFLGGHPLAAGFLIANLSFLGALALLHALTRRERGDVAARATVLALCWFPTSYFFLMPYSESLFLLAAVGCLLAARTERWTLAAIAGAVAASTRSVGIVLAGSLLLEALVAGRQGWRRAMRPLAAATATVGGFAAYLAWWGRSGDLLAPLEVQQQWGRQPSWPWSTLARGASIAWERFGAGAGGYWVIDLLVVVVILAAAAWITPRLRPSLAVYLWGALLMPLSLVFPDRPLMSMPRLVLVAFPAFWGLEALGRSLRFSSWAIPVAGGVGLGIFATLTIHGYYIF